MARKKHLINVHTSTGTTAPTNASLYLGEIAVQHTPNDPALWIKMGSSESSTEYEKFIGKTEILNLIQASNILGSGYTYSGISYVNSATTIADAYSALTRELIDDKLVTTSALNDLNVRLDAICGATHDISSLYDRVASAETVIQQDEETIAGALNDLNVRVGTVETQMTGDYIPITGYMTATGVTEEELTLTEEDTVNEALGKLQKQMLDNEESIAAGLNDLNTRLENVDDIIAHNTGITQLSGAVKSFSAATMYVLENMYDYMQGKARQLQNLSSAMMSVSGVVANNVTNINNVSGSVENLSGAVVNNRNDINSLSASLIDDELVIATALNDLNARIVELSGNTGSSALTLNTHTAVTIANGTSSQMHLPTVSASDNGKILRVVNGAWALVDPATIYSGSTAPA